MPYGSFPNVKSAVNDFINQRIVDDSLDPQVPRTINVSRRFASFLTENGFQQYLAEEEAEIQKSLLIRRLEEVLSEWRALGVRMPLGFSENENILLTWRHPGSSKITGYDLLSPQYIQIFNWLSQLGAREYLFAAALFLRILRCDPIFVTDGPRDGGIDCIGRINESPLRSLIIFVQVKTRQGSHNQIGRDLLLQEYGKYMSLSKTEKYRDYLNALNFDNIKDGCASVFVVMSNVEFPFESQILGRNLGILLRSKRQIAHFLADHVSADLLTDASKNGEILVPARPDLNINYAPLLDSFLSRNRSAL